ncbi:hypothetical protein K2173_025395 [Erythroxylum novogranatense]|uniref:Uncharacterized protein n=1 Tax=Erythroxylum novogranatense TaxID=1862640 RepID=A0AAV8UDT5_9ROSI|nr:hypothetical protein K2173_025395 [Erythroxylum novogranatense]
MKSPRDLPRPDNPKNPKKSRPPDKPPDEERDRGSTRAPPAGGGDGVHLLAPASAVADQASDLTAQAPQYGDWMVVARRPRKSSRSPITAAAAPSPPRETQNRFTALNAEISGHVEASTDFQMGQVAPTSPSHRPLQKHSKSRPSRTQNHSQPQKTTNQSHVGTHMPLSTSHAQFASQPLPFQASSSDGPHVHTNTSHACNVPSPAIHVFTTTISPPSDPSRQQDASSLPPEPPDLGLTVTAASDVFLGLPFASSVTQQEMEVDAPSSGDLAPASAKDVSPATTLGEEVVPNDASLP